LYKFNAESWKKAIGTKLNGSTAGDPHCMVLVEIGVPWFVKLGVSWVEVVKIEVVLAWVVKIVAVVALVGIVHGLKNKVLRKNPSIY